MYKNVHYHTVTLKKIKNKHFNFKEKMMFFFKEKVTDINENKTFKMKLNINTRSRHISEYTVDV